MLEINSRVMEIQQLWEQIAQLQGEHDHVVGYDRHLKGSDREDDVPSDTSSEPLVNSSAIML